MTDKKRCFVIMPFSETKHHNQEYWTRHFESYLKPLIERNKNLEAFRSEPLRGNIASQIITDLVHSDIIVADLTDHNPNVLWELGVRQSYKHCTITIAEKNTEIPFHFSHKGILNYNADHLENEEFEENLLRDLKDCLEYPTKPDSPVLETLGGRGTLYSIVNTDENRRRVEALRMELTKNELLLEKIYSKCEENKLSRSNNKSKDCEMTSDFVKTASSEFLNINRYLDLDEDFYNIVSIHNTDLTSVNEILRKWPEHPLFAEKWFRENKKDINKTLNEVKKYLEKL